MYKFDEGQHHYTCEEMKFEGRKRGVRIVVSRLPTKQTKAQRAQRAVPALTNNAKLYKFDDDTQPHNIDNKWYHSNKKNYQTLYKNCCIAIATKLELPDNQVVNWTTPIYSVTHRQMYTLNRI